MFGYVVANSHNSIIFVDGDAEFKNNLKNIIHEQIRNDGSGEASTSSGVFTDSSEESVPLNLKRKKTSFRFSTSEMSHIFLPLLTFCRSMAEACHEPVRNMSSILGEITIKTFAEDFLIIAFANHEKRRKELIQIVEQTISSSFGPLLTFCNTELTSVKRAKETMNSIMDRFSAGQNRQQFNIKRMLFYSDKMSQVKSIFQKIASQLSVFLGTNKCILTCHGDIIATFNSIQDSESILSSMNSNDLTSLVANLPSSLQGPQISQFWLRSFNGVIPYYVNVINFKLIDNISLVCILEATGNTVIRYLQLFLKQFEQIKRSIDLNRDLKEIKRTAHCIDSLLKSMKPYDTSLSLSFMRNPARASAFIMNAWKQIEDEIRCIKGCEEQPIKSRATSRFSISSIRSAFSSFSMESMALSKVSLNGKNVPKRLDLLLSHAKRQTNSIIQELCSIGTHEAQLSVLPLFKHSIDKIVRKQHIEKIKRLQIGSEYNEKLLLGYLSPSLTCLDMLAYRIHFPQIQREIVYLPEKVQKDLEDVVFMRTSKTFSCDMVAKSGVKYIINHIHVSKDSKQNLLKANLKSDIFVTTAFPPFLSKVAASNQTDMLLSNVLNEMKKIN